MSAAHKTHSDGGDPAPVSLSRPRPDEAPAVIALFERLLVDTFSAFPEQARRHYARDWSVGSLGARLADGTRGILVARGEAGAPVALMFGTPPEGGVATVIWLAVAQEARGLGIGAALLRETFAFYRAAGCHKVKLTTKDDAARAFYRHMGMTEEGRHPNHWWGMDFWAYGVTL